jgi:hypothetical protein
MGWIFPSGRVTRYDDSWKGYLRRAKKAGRRSDRLLQILLKALIGGRPRRAARRVPEKTAAAIVGPKFEELSIADQQAALGRGEYPGHKPLTGCPIDVIEAVRAYQKLKEPVAGQQAARERGKHQGHKPLPANPNLDVKKLAEAVRAFRELTKGK